MLQLCTLLKTDSLTGELPAHPHSTEKRNPREPQLFNEKPCWPLTFIETNNNKKGFFKYFTTTNFVLTQIYSRRWLKKKTLYVSVVRFAHFSHGRRYFLYVYVFSRHSFLYLWQLINWSGTRRCQKRTGELTVGWSASVTNSTQLRMRYARGEKYVGRVLTDIDRSRSFWSRRGAQISY